MLQIANKKLKAMHVETIGYLRTGALATPLTWSQRVNIPFVPTHARLSALCIGIGEASNVNLRVYGIQSSLNGYKTVMLPFRNTQIIGTDPWLIPDNSVLSGKIDFEVVELTATNTWTNPGVVITRLALGLTIEFYRLE